ncbi:class I SAM-dependent methyltransferase [Roseimicrobium sp. ORNL1]|uniref:class I SAM-dependent methyltransferase n=1 Tax=Roseimicrobium sp. ORNL1 TaxID=2711231 RepID=UPI0013E12C3A|nr:class I SAM-dependent methyltransferase [Roseimicrobium sp. ORNL1]QIF00123.1 class I SAM-dependent methyltransferase [Roseimicrobium sp. ORNL1]
MTSSLLQNFPWPKPARSQSASSWTGCGFDDGSGKLEPILYFYPPSSGWSDELTHFHEENAGEAHPIDLASRRYALDSLRRLPDAEPGPVVLDAGCSSGHLIDDVVRELPRVQVIGSDFIASPLHSLAKRHPTVPLLQFDLRACPLQDASMDAVVLLNVLEHIDDDEQALREVARILKPGGLAHIEVPANPDCYDIYDEHLMHYRRYRMTELLDKASKAGLEKISATHLGFFLYPPFLVAKRRGRKMLSLPPEEKAKIVAGQIQQTRGNVIFKWAVGLETVLGNFFSYPCGIRCVVRFRKP